MDGQPVYEERNEDAGIPDLECDQLLPGILDEPLYNNSDHSTRHALQGYVTVFLNKSTSKTALSDMLNHTSAILPQPNNMPTSFKQLASMISKECITIKKLHVCVRDCMFFRNNEDECNICGEMRYRPVRDSLGRRVARRVFSYSSIGQTLHFLFNCKNIAQIMQAAGGCRAKNVLHDITDTALWEEWMRDGGDDLKVVLGFNTDGVNPYHGSNMKYSCWPMIFTIFNLPRFIRTKSDALMLFGVIPSRDVRLGTGPEPTRRRAPIEPDLHIYQTLMVDELLSLVSVRIFSAYEEAPLDVKVKLLIYMMDFQGYSKYFRMTGAVSCLPCNICLIESTRVATTRTNPVTYKRVILGHGGYRENVARRNYHIEVS